MNGAAKSTPTDMSSRSRCALSFTSARIKINCQELQRVLRCNAPWNWGGDQAPENHRRHLDFLIQAWNVSVCAIQGTQSSRGNRN